MMMIITMMNIFVAQYEVQNMRHLQYKKIDFMKKCNKNGMYQHYW